MEVKELADKGLTAEVFEEVNAIDPDFFAQNPILFFQLKQVIAISSVKTFLNILTAGCLN